DGDSFRLTRGRLHQTLCLVLGGGNLLFGLLASARPQGVALAMGETVAAVQAIASRDLDAGLRLLSSRRRLWPLLRGIRSDGAEAIGWLRRKPRLALFPLLWVCLGITAVLT